MSDSFYQLSATFAATEIPSLLGRFVLDPKVPNAVYNRTPPDSILNKMHYGDPVVAFGDWSTTSNVTQKVKAAAGKYLGLRRANNSSTTNATERSIITTRRLKHYYGAFKALCNDRNVELELRSLTHGGARLYITTGVQTVVNGDTGRVSASWSESNGRRTNVTVPLSAIGACFGIQIPTGWPDPGWSSESERLRLSASNLTFVGEQLRESSAMSLF